MADDNKSVKTTKSETHSQAPEVDGEASRKSVSPSAAAPPEQAAESVESPPAESPVISKPPTPPPIIRREDTLRGPPTLDQPSTEGEEEVKESTPPLTRWQQLLEWVEKNSKPKIYHFVKEPLYNGPFARSPMTEEDWDRFDKWAAENAKPREELDEPKPPKRKRAELETLLPRIERLSKPKYVKEKYVFKKIKLYFMPLKPGQPPPEVRPPRVKKPKVHKCFPHMEIEADYWRFVFKIPVSPDALKYKPTENIKKLAQPKEVAPKPEEPIRPRIRMTWFQWIWHLRRLVYLAAPRPRLDPPEEEPLPRGPKKPLHLLEPRCRELSRPKKNHPQFYREPGVVKKSALNATASSRTNKLAQPVRKTKKYKPKKEGTGVKKSALKYTASERIVEISKPKVYPEPEDTRKKVKRKPSKLNEKCYL